MAPNRMEPPVRVKPPPSDEEGEHDEVSEESDEEFDTFVPPSASRPALLKPHTRKRRATGKVGGKVVSVACGRPTPGGVSSRSRKSQTSISGPAKKKRKLNRRLDETENAPRIIFGIDFGTTFTGMSYVWSDHLTDIKAVYNADRGNKNEPKVPSAIELSNTSNRRGPSWGNFAKEGPKLLRWFKLLLLNDADLSDEFRDSLHITQARNRLQQLDMTASDAIGAYLKQFWKGAMEEVKVEVSGETVELSRFYVVVTVPAIWPDYAKKGMERALKISGILNKRNGVANTVFTFISEPEAAALATMKSVGKRCDIERHDCFVVCDAGGGTVDIISYMLNKIEPMEVQEIVPGTGALCGAIFVDEEATKLLKKKFALVSSVPWENMEPRDRRDLLESWTKERDNFDEETAENWTLRLPDSLLPPDHHGERPLVNVTPQEMRLIFEPSVQRILNMVSEQISAIAEKKGQDPKYIFLVGGYGRSMHLRKCLEEHFPDIGVRQSQGCTPWAAISQGAVIHQLTSLNPKSQSAAMVRSRQCRAAYGVVCKEVFDEEKHLDEDKCQDNHTRIIHAKNQMKWLVHKGQDIKTGHKVTHRFFKKLKEGPVHLGTAIYKSDTSPAPTRRDESVTKHSDILWDANFDRDCLPPVEEKDKDRDDCPLRLDYTVQMKFGELGTPAQFSIFHHGRQQAKGSVSVELCDGSNV